MTDARGLDGLALEEKAARLFWVTIHGPAADVPHPANREAFAVDTPAEVIRRHRPGGVVLFAWAGNTDHPQQVAQLVGDLQAAAADVDRPLGVAIDEEGGRISRLGPPATVFPSARAVAAAGDRDLALRRWRAGGAELAAVGVTADLAPVTDLGHPDNPVLGDRTFADDPATVAAHAALAVRGLQEAGVAAVAKHFPGHGATTVDTHEALPVVELSRAQLEPHLEAFRRLLATQPPAGVMTAHLLVRALDADRPATCSPAVVARLLRHELGYGGAVLTDSLSMAGVRAWGEDHAVAVAALSAGADVLLTPPDLPAAVAAVCRAVRGGRITEERLDEALVHAVPLVHPGAAAGSRLAADAAERTVGHPDHRAVAAAVARLAVRVAADPCGRLPLAGGPLVVAGVAGSGARPLADALRRHGRSASLFDLAADDRTGLRLDARDATLVLVRRVPELDRSAQDAILAPLAGRHDDAVLVEAGVSAAPWAGDLDVAVLLAHGGCAASMDAVADALVGT